MPQTPLPKTVVPTDVGLAAGTVITWTGADVGNGNKFVLTGSELILAWNTDVSPRTVTVTSVADAKGRTKDIAADSLLAGEMRTYGRPSIDGWRQADGSLYISANNALVKFAILQLPF